MPDFKLSTGPAAEALTGAEKLLVTQDVGGTDESRVATAAGIAALAAINAVEVVASVSGTLTLDLQGGARKFFKTTLTENVTSLSFANPPAAGFAGEYELHITQDGAGARTFAIPASHKALGGSDTAIAPAANAVTVLSASTVDQGTTWRYAMQESA